MSEIIIIGAGITGLSTARFLKKPYRILEKEKTPGGLCRSVVIDGCTFDYSGHLLHLRHSDTRMLIRKLMGNNIAEIERNAWVYTQGVCLPYPFQANLYALPDAVKNECLAGFMRRNKSRIRSSYPTFLSWSRAVFGDGITRHFMQPYNEKLWTVSARRLTSDWVAPFVPRPSLEEVVSGSKRKLVKRFGYNATFYYPRRGGSQALVDALAGGDTPIEFGVSASRIDCRKKYLETADGRRLHYDHLVSTQPLPELLGSISGLPSRLKAAAARLDWNTVYCLNIAVHHRKTGRADNKHWVYFPDKKYPFYRAGIYSNIAPSMAPAGLRTMYVEVSARPGTNPLSRGVIASLFAGLIDAGLVTKSDRVEIVHQLSMPYAYVIYDRYRSEALRSILTYLASHDIHSIGRYGAWEYSYMEKSIMDGRQTAELLNHGHRK
jgi:protoporphyrinogen oxidase